MPETRLAAFDLICSDEESREEEEGGEGEGEGEREEGRGEGGGWVGFNLPILG